VYSGFNYIYIYIYIYICIGIIKIFLNPYLNLNDAFCSIFTACVIRNVYSDKHVTHISQEAVWKLPGRFRWEYNIIKPTGSYQS